MTILSVSTSLRERVAELGETRSRVEESRHFQARQREAQAVSKKIHRAAQQARLLHESGVAFDPPLEMLGRTRDSVQAVRDRFAAARRADELTRGRNWERMLRGLEEVAAESMRLTETAWTTHVRNLFTGSAPEDLEPTLARTEGNVQALMEYREAYAELQRCAITFPENTEDVRSARHAAESLRRISGGFDFSVPETVKLFLRAVAQGGAPLSLLNPEVEDWLQRNRSYDRYVVVEVRRDQRGFTS